MVSCIESRNLLRLIAELAKGKVLADRENHATLQSTKGVKSKKHSVSTRMLAKTIVALEAVVFRSLLL